MERKCHKIDQVLWKNGKQPGAMCNKQQSSVGFPQKTLVHDEIFSFMKQQVK